MTKVALRQDGRNEQAVDLTISMADVRAILAEIESVELRADEWGSLERLVKDDFTVIKSVAVAYNEVVAAFLVPYRVAIAPYMSDESCINNSATFVRVALMLLRGMGILSASELHNLEFYELKGLWEEWRARVVALAGFDVALSIDSMCLASFPPISSDTRHHTDTLYE